MSTTKENVDMKGLEIVFLAAGGVLGTFLRYRITESPILFGAFQVNVLLVNIIGSFILGLFFVMSQQWNLDTKYTIFAAIGLCGSLTTMSSFALESSNMIDNKQFGLLAINIVTNVGLSIAAILGGKTLMTILLGGLH
ncbi:MAG: CrcB family protein [Nitrososphaera sp.]|jgi:CrcB protein